MTQALSDRGRLLAQLFVALWLIVIAIVLHGCGPSTQPVPQPQHEPSPADGTPGRDQSWRSERGATYTRR